MGATAEVVGFCSELRLERLPRSALRSAKAAILDALACAIAARSERVVRSVSELAEEDGGTPVATAWGTNRRYPAARAALVNGTAAHALDYDDVCWAINGHPTVVFLPAIMAVAEKIGATGRDLLEAYVVALEGAASIGRAVGHPHYDRGWHPTATLGVLGATLGISRLLSLDSESTERAVGIACSEAAGSRMNFGTDTKPLHAGFAASAAVTAANLAAAGATARRDGLEAEMGFFDLFGSGRSVDAIDLGAPLALRDPGIELKPYPSCRFTHRVIDAVARIRDRAAGRTAQRIECDVDPFSKKILIYSAPTTGLEAKFSMEYCAATTMLDGWPTLATFSASAIARRDVRELASRVVLRDGTAARETVRVEFADGSVDTETVEHPTGHPASPLSNERRHAKVEECVAATIPNAAQLIATIEDLENVATVAEVAALLEPAAP